MRPTEGRHDPSAGQAPGGAEGSGKDPEGRHRVLGRRRPGARDPERCRLCPLSSHGFRAPPQTLTSTGTGDENESAWSPAAASRTAERIESHRGVAGRSDGARRRPAGGHEPRCVRRPSQGATVPRAPGARAPDAHGELAAPGREGPRADGRRDDQQPPAPALRARRRRGRPVHGGRDRAVPGEHLPGARQRRHRAPRRPVRAADLRGAPPSAGRGEAGHGAPGTGPGDGARGLRQDDDARLDGQPHEPQPDRSHRDDRGPDRVPLRGRQQHRHPARGRDGRARHSPRRSGSASARTPTWSWSARCETSRRCQRC